MFLVVKILKGFEHILLLKIHIQSFKSVDSFAKILMVLKLEFNLDPKRFLRSVEYLLEPKPGNFEGNGNIKKFNYNLNKFDSFTIFYIAIKI